MYEAVSTVDGLCRAARRQRCRRMQHGKPAVPLHNEGRKNLMTVTMSEALAGCLDGQPDVPEDMFELLTAMVVDDDCSAASEWMLRHNKLPLADG